MECQVTIAEQNYKIDVPAYLLAQTGFLAKVADRTVRIRWQPLHQVFFVADAEGPQALLERCYRIRSHTLERDMQTGQTVLRFQIAGRDPANITAEIRPMSRARAVKRPGQRTLADKQHSPLTGKLTKLYVRSGQTVQKGDQIAIIEAMKMENKILSELAGTVHRVLVQEQGKVSMGEVIFTIAPPQE